MSETDHDLQRLQDLLDVIPPEYDPMCVAQLDGYFAALIVCPDMIPPSEWLPSIWGEDYAFADAAEAEATVAAVMVHYNRIAGELADRPEDYAPVLEIDPGTVPCHPRDASPTRQHSPWSSNSPRRHRTVGTASTDTTCCPS